MPTYSQKQAIENIARQLSKDKGSRNNLSNIPFWCNDYLNQKDGDTCCYNHFIGLPKRWNQRHPMYEYEIELDQHWDKYKKQHIEKAAGLGITEIMFSSRIIWCTGSAS